MLRKSPENKTASEDSDVRVFHFQGVTLSVRAAQRETPRAAEAKGEADIAWVKSRCQGSRRAR